MLILVLEDISTLSDRLQHEGRSKQSEMEVHSFRSRRSEHGDQCIVVADTTGC